ncbi:MAG: kelch repeat-containing protein [Pseudomonadota bacterium]
MALTRRQALTGIAATGFAAACAPAQDAAPSPADLMPGWRSAPDLPIRVQEIYPAVHDGALFVAGGLSPDIGGGRIGLSDRVFSLLPGATRWRELPRLPVATHHPNCVSFGGAVFAIGGFTARQGGAWSMSDQVRVFDFERNQWRAGPDLPTPYAETVAAAVGVNLHLVTGRRPAGMTNANWSDHADSNAHLVLEPGTSVWRTRAPAPTARNSAAGAVLGGRLHVIGGRTVSGGNSDAHEVYDAERDGWDRLAPLPQPEAGPRGAGGLAAAELGGRLYAFGGEWFDNSGGGVYAQVWAYDPVADAWQEIGRMPTPRHGLGAVTLQGAIYTIGGAAAAGGNLTSAAVEVLEPQSLL